MGNDSASFAFANRSKRERTRIYIDTTPSPPTVQVRRAGMVRLQTLVNGERVAGANVLIEDALGNDLYSLYTEGDGYTQWFALPSDFHLDIRGLGGGDNPNHFAMDEYEDSCSDGIDNDGDLTKDTADDDGDTITLTGTTVPSWLTFTASSGALAGTPDNDDVGSHSVVITASDGNGGSVTDSFSIAVATTNDAPPITRPAVTAPTDGPANTHTAPTPALSPSPKTQRA